MNQGGYYPFIMKPEGHSRLYGPGMAEGPLPEHYEPWEAPIANPMSKQQNNPAFKIWRPSEQGTVDKYPIVCSTYRISEHWQGGQMTRNCSWLIEMQPEPFCEMSEELAADKGISNGDRIIVESARGEVNVVALVTKRFKPFKMNGSIVHQVGVIWHWGYTGLSTGDSANVLTPHVGDANTMIPEYKAFLVEVRKA
jgi:formate dehydrogenase major subunit